jgi:hypothetical protein
MPEHEGKDTESGTFAKLLGYGCTHFRQTRKTEWIETAKPETLAKGLLEAWIIFDSKMKTKNDRTQPSMYRT